MAMQIKELKYNQELNLYYKKLNEHFETEKLQYLILKADKLSLATDRSQQTERVSGLNIKYTNKINMQ